MTIRQNSKVLVVTRPDGVIKVTQVTGLKQYLESAGCKVVETSVTNIRAELDLRPGGQ